MPRGIDHHDRGEEEVLKKTGANWPRPLRRWVLHFEASIEDAVVKFAAALPEDALLLDAGAGEGMYRPFFKRQRYVGVDLAVGDGAWDYSKLDAMADLQELPFADAVFDAAVNIVTLEHVKHPSRVLAEISRVLKPGAPFLIVVPMEWEVHQAPHDYYRYTRYGMAFLLIQAGFTQPKVDPVGGFFRLLGRRALNGIQFFPSLLWIPFALPGLLLPLFDSLDREKNFTLGYICSAHKR